MANQKQLAILRRGPKRWNAWRAKNRGIHIDLSGEDLSPYFPDVSIFLHLDLDGAAVDRANLAGADLSAAVLNEADLRRMNLQGANLAHADMHGAKLRQADLRGADLRGADLTEANLTEANLSEGMVAEELPRGHPGGFTKRFVSRATNLSGAILRDADLSHADLSGADLSGADLRDAFLEGASLLQTNLRDANLQGCHVFGVSAWGVDLAGASQSDLIITADREPRITVDNLEVAQFIYVLLTNKKIREVVDTVARKLVLILGRFTPRRKAVLDAIRGELRQRDYIPVLFDFDKPATRDLTETVRTLAHLSRFIIADLSSPKSIPLELQAVVPDLAVPVQPLLASGQREFGMFVDLRRKYPWVLAAHRYKDISDLLASLGDKVIAPAERKAQELQNRNLEEK